MAMGRGEGAHRRRSGLTGAWLAFALLAGPSVLWAEPVTVMVQAVMPDGSDPGPVSWSALPLNLPPEADVLQAMILTPEAVAGPWSVQLEPGDYVFSGFAEAEVFEAEATVTPESRVIEVPLLPIDAGAALRCTTAGGCAFDDPSTGLQATVPEGWGVDPPYLIDPAPGETQGAVSAVFFEDSMADGAAVWFLNPVDWVEDDAAPCREVAIGALCTFELSPAAEAAFLVIAPSLRLAG